MWVTTYDMASTNLAEDKQHSVGFDWTCGDDRKKMVHTETEPRPAAGTIEGEDKSRQVIWNNLKYIIDLFEIDWHTKSVFSHGCFFARRYPC